MIFGLTRLLSSTAQYMNQYLYKVYQNVSFYLHKKQYLTIIYCNKYLMHLHKSKSHGIHSQK